MVGSCHSELALRNRLVGVTVNAERIWIAKHDGKSVSYAEARYGDQAQLMANDAYQKMMAGAFDVKSDTLGQRMTYSLDEVALMLGISSGKLHNWILTGMINQKNVLPPRKDTAKGLKNRFNSVEIEKAKERLKSIK